MRISLPCFQYTYARYTIQIADIPSKPHHNKSTQSRYANTPKQNENENAKKLGAIGIGADT
jgi:hypothetical protein